MTIPLIVFLFLYILFLFVWLIFSLFALYHMVKYGQVNFATFLAVFVFLAGSATIFYGSYFYLSPIDWNASLALFQAGAGVSGVNF